MGSAFESSVLGGDSGLPCRGIFQAGPDLGKVGPFALLADGVAYMQARRAGRKSMDVLSLPKGPQRATPS